MITVTSLTDIPAIAFYLARIGAQPRSFTTAVIRVEHGRYRSDDVEIKFDHATGEITTWDRFTRSPSTDPKIPPTTEETKAIAEALKLAKFPQPIVTRRFTLPTELQAENPENIFYFYNTAGELIFLQQRIDKWDGDKLYLPWGLHDNGEWYKKEPEGLLPLWGLDHLEQAPTIFIHEGAKAARAVHRLVNPHTDEEYQALHDHPLGEEMVLGKHLGWIGGALNPHRTNWSVLKKAGVKTVYIVEDNDQEGREATPAIARELTGMTVYAIRWSRKFPYKWDMADPWPQTIEHYKKDDSGERYYIGPGFDDLVIPATYATTFTPGKTKKDKPTIKLRQEFARQWMWCSNQDLYVCLERPTLCFDKDKFDGVMTSFSDTDQTSVLLKKNSSCVASDLSYLPKTELRVINMINAPVVVNSFQPTQIKPNTEATVSDYDWWEEFLEYLFPVPSERKTVRRWLATLIARPDIRIMFSLLLISDTQGVGKSTLGSAVLAPLLGRRNVSFPSEHSITASPFNSFLAFKRLVFVHEIYSGKSWLAYNRLKDIQTEETVEINKKYIPQYEIPNWVHFVACSNSRKALKIDPEDRRWFYPDMCEKPWPREKFIQFRSWLMKGGLKNILQWALTFPDYIKEGEIAPRSTRKDELIEDSKHEAIKTLEDWVEANSERKMVIWDRALKQFLENANVKLDYITPLDLRKVLNKKGWRIPDQRVAVDSIAQFVMISPPLYRDWAVLMDEKNPEKFFLNEKAQREWLRSKFAPMVNPDHRIMS